ncbi:MAG: hypothetical protein N3E45_15470 [Oscillatoriaceae bacterium SKW80]|nr:hypothetical protein [Oscillatoriaceae bacterium SKW80]HIK29345.1 hypothetical protein [Oscillatoriaceae cyanobacterium M7585_C2015_266]
MSELRIWAAMAGCRLTRQSWELQITSLIVPPDRIKSPRRLPLAPSIGSDAIQQSGKNKIKKTGELPRATPRAPRNSVRLSGEDLPYI